MHASLTMANLDNAHATVRDKSCYGWTVSPEETAWNPNSQSRDYDLIWSKVSADVIELW